MNGIGHEIAVVGSMIVEPERIKTMKHVLRPEHFSDYVLGSIYEILIRMSDEGDVIDAVTVSEKCTGQARERIFVVCEQVPTALHSDTYANAILRRWHERKLKECYAESQNNPLDEWNKQTIKEIWRDAEDAHIDTADMTKEWLDYNDEIDMRKAGNGDHLKSGFPTLDNLTGGGHSRGDVVFLAARPSVGKTSLLTRVALTMAQAGRKVLFLSAEMSTTQIRDRMVSQWSGVPLFRVRRPTAEFGSEIYESIGVLQALPIYLVEGRLRLSRLARLTAAYKPDVVVFDYMQLFSPEPGQKADNKTQFLNNVANELKLFAQERKVLLIGGAQINRMAESQPDREPTLANLKDAGGIEEAADVVVLLHRKNDGMSVGERAVDFIVAKDRNGACGRFGCTFFEETTDFREMPYKQAVSA